MMLRVLVSLCLGLAGQSLADNDGERIVRKPYGIAQCRQLCHELVNCSVYVFSSSNLSCCIPLSSYVGCHGDIRSLADNKKIEANINLVPAGSCRQNVRRVISSRTKGHRCVEWNSEVLKRTKHQSSEETSPSVPKKKHHFRVPPRWTPPRRRSIVNHFHHYKSR